MVPRPTPSALAISATVMSRASYRARASLETAYHDWTVYHKGHGTHFS